MVREFSHISMADDLREQIDRLRDRARSGDDVDPADRELLLAFSNRIDLLKQEYTDYRHKKLLGTCVRISERHGGLAEALEDRAAAESIVAWINREFDNEETNRDYRSVLRVFGRRIAERRDDIETDTDGLPVSLSWIPSGTSSEYDPTPDPREMLHWEDHVIPMLDACHNARDKAMIALQFDAGLRGGEFKSLSLGDLQDHKHGLQVTVEGKQGRRTVTLIPGAPHVNDWLGYHPADRTDRDAPLWSKLHSVGELSDRMVGKVFKQAAERAGITRPVTLTNFRKSSAAFLASRNLNQAHIEDHHGWVRGSRAAARYISVFGSDTDRELAKVHGIEIDAGDKPDRIAPVSCPRCGTDVARHEPVCTDCGQAMTPAAAQELAAVDEDLERNRNGTANPQRAVLFEKLGEELDMDPDVVRSMLE